MAGLTPALIIGCLITLTLGNLPDSSNESQAVVTDLSTYCPGMHAWCPSDKKCCRQRVGDVNNNLNHSLYVSCLDC